MPHAHTLRLVSQFESVRAKKNIRVRGKVATERFKDIRSPPLSSVATLSHSGSVFSLPIPTLSSDHHELSGLAPELTMTVTTNGGHSHTYACKCLNVRINSLPAPEEATPTEKDYSKLYVGDEGISVVSKNSSDSSSPLLNLSSFFRLTINSLFAREAVQRRRNTAMILYLLDTCL